METNEIIIKCPKCQTEIQINEQIIGGLKEKLEIQNQKDMSLRLEEEKKIMWVKAQKAAEEKMKGESASATKLLREQLEEKARKLEAAELKELEIRKEKNRLEEDKKSFELEKQRQLDEERKLIEQKASEKASEEFRLDLAAARKEKEDALKSVAEMKRKLEIGSQQAQGEVQELDIEELLKTEFPTDDIIPVPKGVNGADCIQKVIDQSGRCVGSIVWESKRTKAWSEPWISKLKDDQRLVKGDVGVIVSRTLPDGFGEFGIRDGIYLSSPKNTLNLARILRLNLVRLHGVKSMEAGRDGKKEVMYNYLCGAEFRGRIEAVVEASISAKKVLDSEKRAYAKLWAAREKQIEKIEMNMIGMYGEMQGIAGQALPEIKNLELPSGEEELEQLSEDVTEAVTNPPMPEASEDVADNIELNDNEATAAPQSGLGF